MSSGSSRVERCVEPARSQNITVRWRRSALGRSRSAAGAGGLSACRKAGNGCDSAVRSGWAARPSGAQTRSSPSRSAASRLMPISSRRRSSRASSSRPKPALYTAIGDAALGDEAPEDLFQHPLKVHASAPVCRASYGDRRPDLLSWRGRAIRYFFSQARSRQSRPRRSDQRRGLQFALTRDGLPARMAAPHRA